MKSLKKIGLLLGLFALSSLAAEDAVKLEIIERSLGLKAPVSGGFVVRGKVERTGVRFVDGKAVKHSLKVFKDSQATLPVFFSLGKVADETGQSEANTRAIQALAQLMAKYPAAKFVLEGHTCDLGKAEENAQLSWQRAEAVKGRLLALGVDPQRVLVLGFGETEGPVNLGGEAKSPETEEARKNYRRVVVRQLAP